MTLNTAQGESSTLRLARYLKEFVGLRTTTVRDVTKYDSVLWFGDMPQDSDCKSPAWIDDHDAETPWLEVKKQDFEKVPVPPESILPWVDGNALKCAAAKIPPLLETIFIRDTEAELEEDETPPLIEQSLKDHPEVQRVYEQYRPVWEAWSTEHRRRESVQRIYAELFRLHTQVLKQGEIIEVILGLGLLDWKAKLTGGIVPIRRHVIVARVELEFIPTKGVIRVVPPGDGVRLFLEDDMLEAELRPDRTFYATVNAQLEHIGDDVWDKTSMHAVLRTWASALSADTMWSPGLGVLPGHGNSPSLSFAPALILRKRPQTGMVRVYDQLIEQLSEEVADVPKGWNGLVDDTEGYADDSDHVLDEGTRGHGSEDSIETYFPLPANREQRRIVEAIERQRGVLVQGPPGTGKSHTIANLVCHLLATGKRVLITAETVRALQVLKDKLPPEIQSLCISLLGQGGDSFAELNSAVHGITTRQAAYSPGMYDSRIEELDDELDRTRRNIADIDSEIRSLREEETTVLTVGNGVYCGTASVIAERVAREREQYSWLKLPKGASVEPPLQNQDLRKWLDILRRYTAEELLDATLRTPTSSDLVFPVEFASVVALEKEALAAVSLQERVRSHPAYSAIHALSVESRAQLASAFKKLEKQRLSLPSPNYDWARTALQDLVAERRARWDTVLKVTHDHLSRTDSLLERLTGRMVTIPNGIDPRKVRSDAAVVLKHLARGGKWKNLGFLIPKELKGRTYLKDDVLVNGEPACDTDRLRVVCDHLDLEFAVADIASAWRSVGAALPDGDRRLCIAALKEHTETLQRYCDYLDHCRRLVNSMTAVTPPIPAPDWLSGQVQEWLVVIEAANIQSRYEEAAQVVAACVRSFSGVRDLHDVHPVTHVLIDAVEARDVNAYSQGYACLLSIEATRVDQAERIRIEKELATAAPCLITDVSNSLHDKAWDDRFDVWTDAWHWAFTDMWLEKRSNPQYQQDLWRRRHQAEKRQRVLLEETVALRSWRHFFERLSPRQTAALKSWREAVRSMGKGTGRSVKMARVRKEARQYMAACREAIPIWIMPRYLVADLVELAPSRYDLVIVDEASQLGIESLFLFYIAKKMVVVGDDQQISPYGVGIADEAIAGLQQHYLDGIPHHHALSAQSSLYANAKIRFNQNIVLREHFRCMPEIIQFSNDLCYASNGTPLDPLRAYPANRLQPLVLRHVSDGYRIGSPQYAQNPAEADAIIAQILACIEDPRYEEATMGVISLQGETQARLIERKLLECVPADVIEKRRLICGDSYAFQGDERDVIFLSMVAAPGEKRIGTLATESARQRFNVAVSRAKDQLWLFHTATLDVLSDACMRYRLLSYMLNPARHTTDESEQSFDSDFECEVFRRLVERGFHVRTQVCVGDPTNHRYRIDIVVEGMQGKLAVECDGDKWHGPERYERDMARQRDLERVGWQFVRIRGGDFYRDQDAAMLAVWSELDRLGIKPGGVDKNSGAPPAPVELTTGDAGLVEEDDNEPPEAVEEYEKLSPAANLPVPPSNTPFRAAQSDSTDDDFSQLNTDMESEAYKGPELSNDAHANVTRRPYVAYNGNSGPDPREASTSQVADTLQKIIDVEGPMLAKRAYDVYLRGCGIRRMGGELKRVMNRALQYLIREGRVLKEDESDKGGLMYSVVRSKGTPPVLVRSRGPRTFEEIPPSELLLVALRLAEVEKLTHGSDRHLRVVLDSFDLKRLTVQVNAELIDILDREYPYVDDIRRQDEP